MLWDSQIVTRASGSFGGITAGHNRGGNYFRARVTPTDPSTTRQNTLRSHFRVRLLLWRTFLTQAQRDAWDVYASNVPLTGPLGHTRDVGGMQMFVRQAVPRGIAALPAVLDAPTTFDLGGFTPNHSPTALRVGFVTQLISVLTPADTWANTDGAALLCFAGIPVNPGVKFFAGPYRFSGTVLGNSAAPPPAAAVFNSQYNGLVGQRVFWRLVVASADGRYSNDQKLTAIVAP